MLEQGPDSTENRVIQRGIPSLNMHIKRTAYLYAFFADLASHAQTQSNEHTLQWWERGSICERRYLYRGSTYVLRPDAAFAYKAGHKRLVAWIEWEEETASKQTIASRLQTYAHYAHTREWRAGGFSVLPALLIIVPAAHHLQPISAVITEQLTGTELQVRMATATSIAEKGPLAAIWLPVLPPSTQKNGYQGLLL
jgi:hypothetical protein